VDAREKRLADNETLFREVNERVRAVAQGHGSDQHRYAFFCECSNADCTLQLELTQTEYESARGHGSRFIVARGHELPEIEHVVERHAEWSLIEKDGEAARIAEARDPRDPT
jgi:hypothetical protein